MFASGFNHKDIKVEFPVKNNEPEKIVVKLGDISNITETRMPEQWPVVARQPESMAPTLVEMPAPAPYINNEYPDIKPSEVFITRQADVYKQPVEEPVTVAEPPAPVYVHEEKRPAEIPMQLVIKDEESEPVMKIGERVLSAEEIEEKRRFEEQKKALEDRAERLRRMSFNIKGTESNDEMEAVPAYMRKNMKLDNTAGSSDSYYSGYTVGMNDNQENPQAAIQTINTFLDGKKPD